MKLDLAGKKIGIWTVIEPHHSTRRGIHWLCRCDCGNEKVVVATELKRGEHTSCYECTPPNQTHGMRYTSEYKIWLKMRQRCNNPNDPSYHHYGGRGIEVCNRWNNSFENFYEDMGPRPSENHSIDRIENSEGYTPENTRWATPIQQANNSRKNTYITFDGETKTIAQWSRDTGISYPALLGRIEEDWPVEKMLTEPTREMEFHDITFNGKTQNMKQWARDLGIKYTTLRARLLRYEWSVERAFTEGVGDSVKSLITFNGKTQSITEWAEEIGINETTLHNRLKNLNWSVERALTEPLNKNYSHKRGS